jgi:hypothetical protein
LRPNGEEKSGIRTSRHSRHGNALVWEVEVLPTLTQQILHATQVLEWEEARRVEQWIRRGLGLARLAWLREADSRIPSKLA